MSFSTRGIRGCEPASQGEPGCRSVRFRAGQGSGESRKQFLGKASNAQNIMAFWAVLTSQTLMPFSVH